jgi:NADH-quinone oxidoreductase subunit L
MFHLFTHAFFKALLFLGAGSVMHAMGNVIDVREFGGLRRLLPRTHWTFLIGCLALAGVVPLSGFWSKDAILVAVHERMSGGAGPLYHLLYYAALGTAFLTAFYTFRAYFLTFHGKERIPAAAGGHAHESPPSMTVPLVVLAIGAAGVGGYFEWTHDFADFLHQSPSVAYLVESVGEPAVHAPSHAADEAAASEELTRAFWRHVLVGVVSTVVALAGIALAAAMYLGREGLPAALARAMGPLYTLSHRKFFFDEIYDALIVQPLRLLADFCYWLDAMVVDGLVNLFGWVPRALGALLRPTQSGLIPFYALAMALGLLVLIGALTM